MDKDIKGLMLWEADGKKEVLFKVPSEKILYTDLYKLVSYDKATNTEREICGISDKKKVFQIMNIELQDLPNTSNHYIITEFTNYTRYKNGIYEFRLYNKK